MARTGAVAQQRTLGADAPDFVPAAALVYRTDGFGDVPQEGVELAAYTLAQDPFSLVLPQQPMQLLPL
ncbi:MAG: hypothetical protein ACKN82_18400, partial [Pirellula sp.]